ncbi:hypothetical protein EWM64_g9638 [Hericium alpestre]|uniref:Uncharacterized protein n=1 Tax=Hericium alpestre TaxID=135208 RepID=A0A4Y9ZIV0_9AGAM|nr:hypothetical protein EWM64_g9638 [Hericium alpestre]
MTNNNGTASAPKKQKINEKKEPTLISDDDPFSIKKVNPKKTSKDVFSDNKAADTTDAMVSDVVQKSTDENKEDQGNIDLDVMDGNLIPEGCNVTIATLIDLLMTTFYKQLSPLNTSTSLIGGSVDVMTYAVSRLTDDAYVYVDSYLLQIITFQEN